MLPWRSKSASSICWACQWRLDNHSRLLRLSPFGSQRSPSPPKASRRALHATRARAQQIPLSNRPPADSDASLIDSTTKQRPIREILQEWDREFGGPDEITLNAFENFPTRDDGGIKNILSPRGGASASVNANKQDVVEDEIDDQADISTIGLFLEAGDLVEVCPPGGEPVLGVHVQRLEQYCQIYTSAGRWIHQYISKIDFAIKGCVDPDLITPIIPYLPTKIPDGDLRYDILQVPANLAAPVRATLRRIETEAERVYRENASDLESTWSKLAYPDRSRLMTLASISTALLGKHQSPDWEPSTPEMLAVRKALRHDNFRLSLDRTHGRLTQTYTIRPKNEVSEIESVMEWVREYQEHRVSGQEASSSTNGVKNISSFVNKARRIISASRKHRLPHHGYLGPSRTTPTSSQESANLTFTWGEKFTEADKQIVRFFQTWSLRARFASMSELHSAASFVINAIGKYEKKKLDELTTDHAIELMDQAAGLLLLQEIGVITPYEDRKIYDDQLMLPGASSYHNVELLKAKSELAQRNPNFVDSMADLRQDFKSMLVWCIDDVNSQEIDDGISVEKIQGQDAGYWIHVHVANPTAFFSKTHVLSGLAAHLNETFYSPAGSYPMLPKWISQDYFSLGSDRPSITFSTRINTSGDVLETKVQHGIIRNVQAISYAELADYMGESHLYKPQNPLHVTVGGKIAESPQRPLPPRSNEELENLRDLYAAAKSVFANRQAAGAFRTTRKLEPKVRIFETPETPGLSWLPASMDRARFVQGDPIIEYTADLWGPNIARGMNSRLIVEELMSLTNAAAGSWCAERGIPSLFRGTVVPPRAQGQHMSVQQFLQEIVNPQVEEIGYISPAAITRLAGLHGKTVTHHSPVSHNVLGVEAYVRVTSPLRRFTDMMAHWQIEAAVRWEARTGQKLDSIAIASMANPPLPFSRRQIEESLLTLVPQEQNNKFGQRLSERHWQLIALMRAFHFGEAALPETFPVWVTLAEKDFVRGKISGAGDFQIMLDFKSIGQEMQLGDLWESKIKHVSPFDRRMVFKPVRLIYRSPVPLPAHTEA